MLENVFKRKFFLIKKGSIFRFLFAILKSGSKNIFQYLAHMKYHQIFVIFSYNMRSCEKERQIMKMNCGERECVRIKSFWKWDWDPVQLHAIVRMLLWGPAIRVGVRAARDHLKQVSLRVWESSKKIIYASVNYFYASWIFYFFQSTENIFWLTNIYASPDTWK